MENFWLEYQVSNKGEAFTGTFKDAMARAFDMCSTVYTIINVYNSNNEKIAQQTINGARWVRKDYLDKC